MTLFLILLLVNLQSFLIFLIGLFSFYSFLFLLYDCQWARKRFNIFLSLTIVLCLICAAIPSKKDIALILGYEAVQSNTVQEVIEYLKKLL